MNRAEALAFDPRAEFRRLLSKSGTMTTEQAERAVRDFQDRVEQHLTHVVEGMQEWAQTPEDEQMVREAWQDREETRALQETHQ